MVDKTYGKIHIYFVVSSEQKLPLFSVFMGRELNDDKIVLPSEPR
jgi:hypothetical protein